MLGRATLTMETSSRVMNPAARTTASAFQRSGSGRYSPPRGGTGRAVPAEGTVCGSSTRGPTDLRRWLLAFSVGGVDMPRPSHRARAVASVRHPSPRDRDADSHPGGPGEL